MCIKNDKILLIKHDNFQIFYSKDVSNFDLIFLEIFVFVYHIV